MTQKFRRPAGERAKAFKSDLDSALDGGKGEVETLKDEIEEWSNSLESNNMEHLPKYDEVTEAKDALEAGLDRLESIDVPDFLRDESADYTQDTRRKADSRSGRLDNALNQLNAAKDAAQFWIEQTDELKLGEIEDGETITQEMVDERHEQIEAADTFVGELEDAIGELENVSFPGMY